MKYLAHELLAKTEVPAVLEKIGTVSVNIGGIAINDPLHVIDCGNSESVEVMIGNEFHTVTLDESDESDMSTALRQLRADQTAELEAAESEETE